MKLRFCLLLLWVCIPVFSQVPDGDELYHHVHKDSVNTKVIEFESEEIKEEEVKVTDLKYREDQFYLNLTYLLLQNRPQGVSQNAFSSNVRFGFLRDFPINERRNIAIAPGVGYSFSSVRSNLFVFESVQDIEYSISDEFDRNKLSLHYIDVPIEFRWRTSTPKNIKFWRIYAGFKVSFLIYDRSKNTDIGSNSAITGNDDLNKVRYGAYLTLGHGTWNFYAYYGLNPIFKSARLDGSQSIDMTSLNLGLMFYIL